MKKKWLIIAGVLVVIVIFVIVALKSNKVKRTPVTVEKAQKSDITSLVTATGKVKAQADVYISADVIGRIEELPVKEGDTVRTGELLIKIDSRSREMDVAQARGSLQSAKSALGTARITFDRENEMFKKALTSKAQLDIAQNNLDQADASLVVAEASLDRAVDQLAKSTIRSPMDGVITTLNSKKGEHVIMGTLNNAGTAIMVISDLSSIVIEAEVDETDIASVHLGQSVKIALDAFPDTTFNGEVIQVGNAAKLASSSLTDQVTNFDVKILIKDIILDIKPGMTASVDITTASRDSVVAIPSGAVVMRSESILKEKEKSEKSGNGKKTDEESTPIVKKAEKDLEGVFLVKGGKADFVQVHTGIRDQQNIEIISGLNQEDSVITGPYRTLRTIKQGEDILAQKPKLATDTAVKASVTVD